MTASSAPPANPFDEPPPDSEDELDESFEGAGVASSLYDVGKAVEEQDTTGILASGAVAALDYVSYVRNPLEVLTQAGVGWLLEHVRFLREPLDALCGDAEEIRGRAGGWARLSQQLEARAGALDRAVGEVPAMWTGDAAGAYLGAATNEIDRLRVLSGDARGIAEVVLTSGVLVGTERAVIRDLIADFLASLIPKAIAVMSATAATAGVGALTIGALVADIASFALYLVKRLEAVVKNLGEMAQTAHRIARSVASRTEMSGVDALAAAGFVTGPGKDAGLELQKQRSSADVTRTGWDATTRLP